MFVVCVLFKLCSYGDADAPRVDVSAVVPYVGVQNNYRMQEEQGYTCLLQLVYMGVHRDMDVYNILTCRLSIRKRVHEMCQLST